jgi:hypothetical protein
MVRFIPTEQQIDCRDLDLAVVAAQAADLLETRGVVVFRVGRLRLDEAASRRMVHELAEAMREALLKHELPPEAVVEIDRPQDTPVPGGGTTRTMLPHHDGMHSSYLTPSLLDVADWQPEWRTFSDTGYTTTHSHKLYQGLFITNPGEGLSATPYYDWLQVLADVHAAQGGEPGAAVIAAWLGANLRHTCTRRAEHGALYPTIAGMLGLREPAFEATPVLRAEADLSEQARRAHPILESMARRCPCGECAGEEGRLLCHVLTLAAGGSWPEFRRRYEVLAVTERYDFVMANNLTFMHGGLAGGRDRTLEPICLVAEPWGDAYERWLARSWRRLERRVAATAGV